MNDANDNGLWTAIRLNGMAKKDPQSNRLWDTKIGKRSRMRIKSPKVSKEILQRQSVRTVSLKLAEEAISNIAKRVPRKATRQLVLNDLIERLSASWIGGNRQGNGGKSFEEVATERLSWSRSQRDFQRRKRTKRVAR